MTLGLEIGSTVSSSYLGPLGDCGGMDGRQRRRDISLCAFDGLQDIRLWTTRRAVTGPIRIRVLLREILLVRLRMERYGLES